MTTLVQLAWKNVTVSLLKLRPGVIEEVFTNELRLRKLEVELHLYRVRNCALDGRNYSVDFS